MIADKLENLHKYQSVLPYVKEISKYLENNDIFSLDTGKYPVVGDSVYLLIQEYQTKPEQEKKWESHKKYIDIQIVLSGQEYMGYSPDHLLTIKDPYKPEKDVIIYENDDQEHTRLLISQNFLSIFFPGDAHKPGYHIAQEANVKKAVIKVLKD